MKWALAQWEKQLFSEPVREGKCAVWSNSKGLPLDFLPHDVEWRPGAGSVPNGQGCSALAPSQTSPGATSHLQKLPCPGMTLHRMETAAFCRLLEGQKGGNFTLHSLHLCSYLPFQGHLSSVAGLPLDCTIFPLRKAPNHFKRQENEDATRLKKGVLDINHLSATGIQRIQAGKKWNLGALRLWAARQQQCLLHRGHKNHR